MAHILIAKTHDVLAMIALLGVRTCARGQLINAYSINLNEYELEGVRQLAWLSTHVTRGPKHVEFFLELPYHPPSFNHKEPLFLDTLHSLQNGFWASFLQTCRAFFFRRLICSLLSPPPRGLRWARDVQRACSGRGTSMRLWQRLRCR